jgi:hypothetical protein
LSPYVWYKSFDGYGLHDCHQHWQYLVMSYTKQVLLGVTNGLPTVQLPSKCGVS